MMNKISRHPSLDGRRVLLIELPANLELSPSHDESTVGQKLLSDFDVSTIATDLHPSAGNDLENPSLSDDPPRTIPFLEDKSLYDSHRETFVNRDLIPIAVINSEYSRCVAVASTCLEKFEDTIGISGSDFDDPFQALSNYQITTFEDSSELYYDRHVEDIDKVFMQEPEADDHPYQSDSLHAPKTISGFPNTIREKTTKFSANKPIQQSSSSGSVVTYQDVEAYRERRRLSSIDASSVLPEKKARSETMTAVEFSSAPQVTLKALSWARESDLLAPQIVLKKSGDLLTGMPRVTPKYMDLEKKEAQSALAACRSQIEICTLIENNVKTTPRIPGCGFFHPAKFMQVMFSLCDSSYKNAFPKTIIGIGSGRGFLEKCFELMGGLNVKCYDRKSCNEFIPVESAEFPQDISRILPDNCSSSVLVAGYPSGYLGRVLSEFIRRGGETLCTTVQDGLFSDMHGGRENDPDILRKAINELRKNDGEFFEVKLSNYHPMLGGKSQTYIQFYNWSPIVKKAIFECPELSGFCSDIVFPAVSHTDSPQPDLKESVRTTKQPE